MALTRAFGWLAAFVLIAGFARAQPGPAPVRGDNVSIFCTGNVCSGGNTVATTKTAGFTVAAGDMGKLTPVNISGGGTITLPSSGAFTTVLGPRQTWCVQNIGTTADPIVNSTGGVMYPTITSLLPDNTICFSSNGSALFAETKVSSSPSRSAASPTIGVGDMMGTIFITSGGFTIPAISPGIFDTKQTQWMVNYGGSASVPTNSSGQSIKTGGGCVAASGIPAGGTWVLQPDTLGSTFQFDCVQTVSVSSGGGGGGGSGVSGQSALGTSAISSAACATVVSPTATGTISTSVIDWGFSSDPTGVTGYAPLVAGMLTISAYPTTDHANFKVCNMTASSITPGAITLNWSVNPSMIVASGTSAMGTSAIASATCATLVTTGASGALTTDTVSWGFNGDPTAVTGYVPLVAGMLSILWYPTANNVNFKVCNNTNSSITPGAITLNWKVSR